MKPLKKACQKNAPINKDYYSTGELFTMWLSGEIGCLTKDENGDYLKPSTLNGYVDVSGYDFRIFLNEVKDIKVTLDEWGTYTTVAVSNSGKTYYINL